ncbi:MAG: hypothetical protein WC124_00180 [Desulfoplanes sp.]
MPFFVSKTSGSQGDGGAAVLVVDGVHHGHEGLVAEFFLGGGSEKRSLAVGGGGDRSVSMTPTFWNV